MRLAFERLEGRLLLATDLRDLLVADPTTDSILAFDGASGAPLGAFVDGGSGGLVDPHDPTFGPDGNLYVFSTEAGNQKILRYDGDSGDFLDEFVGAGVGGSQMAFGPDGNLYLATAGPAGVLRFDGSSGAPLGVAAAGNSIQHTGGLPAGDSYTETLTTTLSGTPVGEFRVLVVADRLGQVPDPDRANNRAFSARPLQVALPLSPSHDPDRSIAVGRTLSAYTTQDIVGDQLTIAYTVYNLLPAEVSGVLLTTALQSDVTLQHASVPADANGQELAWSLGTLGPFGSATVEITVSLGAAGPLQIDSGPIAYAHVDGVAVADELAAAVLRTDAIDPALLAATVDADAADPFVLAKAAELNQDAAEIYQYVRDGIAFQSYVGSLRGARGTLWSGAGNALDQANLLLALLRGSGIPARYAQGTLADADARQLIVSMFPGAFRTIGLVPTGAAVADPANDPQLLDEVRGHFWTQFDTGAGLFEDADPAFAGAAIGDTFAGTVGPLAEVPDDLRHKVTVRLNRELAIPAVGLFTGGSPLSEVTVLEQTFNSAELAGRPLTIGHFVHNQTQVTPIVTAITNTYSPYLAVGDEAKPLNDSHLIRGTDYQEFITNFPLGTQVLTGVFLEVDLTDPAGSFETYRRALADRIGFDIRQNGGTPNLQIGADSPPLVTESDAFTLYALPGLGNPRRSDALPQELQAIVNRLEQLPPDDPTGQTTHLERLTAHGLTRLLGDVLLQVSDVQTVQLADASLVRAYFDKPRLVLVSSRANLDVEGSEAYEFSIDLRRNTLRALPFPGQNPETTLAFRATWGLLENANEEQVVASVLGSGASAPARSVGAIRVLEEAAAQGISLVGITQDTLALLETLAISDEAKARITATIAADTAIVVPAQMVNVDGRPAIAWLDMNVLTGETIGVTEDGGHQSIAEFAATKYFGQVQDLLINTAKGLLLGVVSGQFLGVAAKLCQISDPAGDSCKAFIAFHKQQTIELAEKIAKLADDLKYPGFDIDSFKTAFNGTVQIMAHVDPPVPNVLVNPLPAFPLPENTGSSDVAVAAGAAAGAVAGAVDTPHAQISGSLHVNWTTATKVGLSVATLDAATATVLDEFGATVGTGTVSLDEAAWAQVSCTPTYDVTGHGTLSSYASATSGLGFSAQWDDYDLTLTGGAAIELNTSALVLNGVMLPAGTYRITAPSASITGSGASTAPDFIGSFLIDAADGTVLVGPSSQDLSVGGGPFDVEHGLALSGFAGTVTITADTTLDTLVLAGTAEHVLRVFGDPAAVSADQNTGATFDIRLETSWSDTYSLQAEAPAGWTIDVGGTGTVTVSLPPGLQGGSFPIRLSAQSLTHPDLVAHAEVLVTVGATAPGVALDVESDPLLFVPFFGAQVPTAYQVAIRNPGPAADTFELTIPVVPAGFEVLTSMDAVRVPAGETAVVGLYLNPVGVLPPPGDPSSFSVTATSTSNPAITDTQNVPFVVPEIHGLTLLSDPVAVSTIPGVGVEAVLVVEARGNVTEDVTFDLAAAAGLSVDGLQPLTLDPGELEVLFLTLTPDADTPLNSTLTAEITASLGAPQTVTVLIPVDVVAPGVESVADAAVFVRDFLGNVELANRLDDLGIAMTNLAQTPSSEVFRSQAVASLDSILTLLAVDPLLVHYVDDFQGPRDELAAATTEAEVLAALNSLSTALEGFADAVFARNEFNFELFLIPNTQAALPQTPTTYQLIIHHIGGVSEGTYNIGLSPLTPLPPTVTIDLSETQVMLDRDEIATVLVTLEQTSLDELAAFDFQLDVSVEGHPEIVKSVVGSMTARDEFVQVVSVTATPPFTDAGGLVNLDARVLNAVNRAQLAHASFVVTDSNGVPVGGPSVPVDVLLTVQTSLVDVDLGDFDTTGLADGTYFVEVTLTDENDDPIPGSAGTGSFLVGSPVRASLGVTPDVLPPGTNPVTNTLEMEATAFPLSAPEVVGLKAVAGANDVVRNGDYVYVAGSAGISVFNIAGANVNDPVLVRVVGSATSYLRVRGNLLVAVRGLPGGDSTRLDTYSLTDPSNPQLLGTTGDIPYGSAADVVVTDTHAFIVLVNFVFVGGFDIIDQNGGVIAVNITDPADPFFDGDAVGAAGTPAGRDGVDDGVLFNENGTNNDGVKFVVIDQSAGNQMTWSAVQASPSILLVAGSSATGTDTQAGVGLVRVVDISDPRNMHLVRDLQIPGTVHILDIAMDGNRALITGTEGGLADFNSAFPFTGNTVLATLDLTDPSDPQIVRNEETNRGARGLDRNVALGGGLFAFSSLGPVGAQPGLFVLNRHDPAAFVGLDVPAQIVGLSAGGELILTADGSNLIIYRVPTAEPLTLVGQESIAGARGVAVRNDVAYVSSSGGIRVVDVSDPVNPSIVRTLAGNHLGARVQDNVLLALRPSGSAFILDVYALQNDPLNPPLIGSSPAINYNLQTDLRSNSTHAFVAQSQVCFILGSLDVFHQAGDMISIALNLDDPDNPTSAAPALDSVLFNTFGDATPGQPGDVSGCPRNGGEHNVWKVELPDSQTALLATTTSTGTLTQVGVGRIQVVDIADPSVPSVVGELDIPGTVQAIGLGVDGDAGVVIGSTGGWNDPFNPGVLAGNLTITTLDLSDARAPVIVASRTLDRVTGTFWANTATLGNNLFAFSNLGYDGTSNDPAVLLVDASNPRNPVVAETSIPLDLVPPNSIASQGDLLFTTDNAGLSIYEIGDIPGIPATARVQVPNGIVTGSFNTPPAEIIPGVDFYTLVWDLTLTPTGPSQLLTWMSTVADLQPGELRPVTLDTTIDFGFQGTPGQLMLPPVNVVAEQVLALDPAEQTVRPGEPALYTLTIDNPSALGVTYDLSVAGVPQEWVDIVPQVTVPAGTSLDVSLTLTSDPFTPLDQFGFGTFGFVVSASVNGTRGSVAGTLFLNGDPVLPEADPVANGVVVTLAPETATAGQGTAAGYVARVTNTGSASDEFVLFVTGLPFDFSASFDPVVVTVPPGTSNFVDVPLTIVPPEDAAAGDYPFTVTAASITEASISDVTEGLITVLELGVDVQIAPASGDPESSFEMMVRNTGDVTETYDLALAGPAALFSSLQTAEVTLDPDETAFVTIDVGPIDVSFPGGLSLVAIAEARSNDAVRDSAEALVNIPVTEGLEARFEPDAVVLPAPGEAASLLRVDNVGNTEVAYEATIVDTTGPILARLVGLDGQTTNEVSVFRLPGLSPGTIPLEAELLAFGVGTVTVRVTSLFNPAITSDVTFLLQAQQATVPPTAEAGGPYAVDEGATVLLAGSGEDPDGETNPLTFAWDLDGDGQFGETGPEADRGDETGATPTFDAHGLDGFPGNSVTVTLRVTDDEGETAEDTATIEIRNAPPLADAGGPYTVTQGGAVVLGGSATDPAGALDPLTFAWDLDGDGQFGETGADAGRGDETGLSPTFDAGGLPPSIVTVALRVSDGDGGVGEDTAEITIEPALLVVQQIIVNGGAVQRSNVDLIEILVSGSVDVQSLIDSGAILDAVEIHGLIKVPGEVSLTPAASHFQWNSAQGKLSIDLTVDGFGGSRRTLLHDDRFELRLIDEVFADTDGLLDGLYRFGFHRLEGDFDGSAAVNLDDRDEFLAHYVSKAGQAKYDVAFDLTGDGFINISDYKKWQGLIGHSV